MKSWRWQLAQYLEEKWWKKYLADKKPGEYIRWKTDYWRQLLNELSPELTLRPDQKILDAGCGPAGIFLALHQHEVVAIDPLLDAYRKLPHFSPEDFPNTTFKVSDIEHFTTEDRFDVIFCLNAINHVADIQKAYDVLESLLKPGGILVVSIDTHNYVILKHLFRSIPGDVLHPHQYSLNEYERFLQERGLTVMKTILKNKGYIFNYYVQIAVKK